MDKLEELDRFRRLPTERVVVTEDNINRIVNKINEIIDYINAEEEKRAVISKELEKMANDLGAE